MENRKLLMKKSQVLLIVIMVMATILTVVLAVTFKSVNESRITKLEEESQKTLAAAEAAIETALKTNSAVTIGEGQLSSFTNMTGTATVEDLITNVFTSGAIAKDSSYTFYLTEYDPAGKTFITGRTSINEPVTVCFDSASPNPAIEITLVKTESVRKYVIDPDERITNAFPSQGTCTANTDFEYSYTVPGSDILDDSRLMLVRVLYGSSKLIISRATNFTIQGRIAFSDSSKASLSHQFPKFTNRVCYRNASQIAFCKQSDFSMI